MLNILNIIFILLSKIITTSSTTEKHKVNDLFNGTYNKEIYSGYLNTDVPGRDLFYIFTPSQYNPVKDPFILWITGGPSCSSLYSIFDEIGPVIFLPHEKKPVINEYAWNKNASVLYIESPGGVGFSTLENPNFIFNDINQAISLNHAVQNFFKIFTEYKKNTFFIAGLSYAGTYIPHIVTQMFKYMKENKNATQIKLKGILIGNPYTYEFTDFEDSMVEFAFSHALISIETFNDYLKECPHWPQVEKILEGYEEKKDYKFEPLINKDQLIPKRNVSKACNKVRMEIKNSLKGINSYGILNECPSLEKLSDLKKGYTNIDYDKINSRSERNILSNMIKNKINEKYLKYKYGNDYLNNNSNDINNNTEYAIDYFTDCEYSRYTPNFINDNQTKEKLGVNTSINHQMCANINYKWGDAIYFYQNEIKNLSAEKGFTSWLYSGTEDMQCTTLATLRTLNKLNYSVIEKWKKWKVDDQVVGMEQTYEYGINFITVKNAGHLVVEDQPKISKLLLDKFIEYNIANEDVEPLTDDPHYPSSDDPENTGEMKLQVWAIVIISIGSFLVVLILVLIIHRRCKGKSDAEIEEGTKLISQISADD